MDVLGTPSIDYAFGETRLTGHGEGHLICLELVANRLVSIELNEGVRANPSLNYLTVRVGARLRVTRVQERPRPRRNTSFLLDFRTDGAHVGN